MTQLRFVVPDRETPGFLRRIREALRFQEAIKQQQVSAKLLDEMIDFLVTFVEEPDDPKQAKDMLLDASQEQFEQLLNSISGGDADPLA